MSRIQPRREDVAKIYQLEQRLAALERSSPVQASTLSAQDGAGTIRLKVGLLDSGVWGVRVFDATGAELGTIDSTSGGGGGGVGPPGPGVYLSGVVADGTTDNRAVINAALAVPGVYVLPCGPIALSGPLSFHTAGVWLVAQGFNLQPTSDNGGQLDTATAITGGTHLVPLSSWAQGTAGANSMIYAKSPNCGLRGLNLSTYPMPSAVDYHIYTEAAASDFKMEHISWQGTVNVSEVAIGGPRSNLISSYGNSQTANGTKSLDWTGVDGVIDNCRFKGGIKRIAGGNMQIQGGHWTGGNDNLLIEGAASVHAHGTLFDSANNNMIHHNSSGLVDLTGCDFYIESGGPVVLNKTGTGKLQVVGGEVRTSGGFTFAYLGSGLSNGDRVSHVLIDSAALAGALWSDAGPELYDVLLGTVKRSTILDSGVTVATVGGLAPSATAGTYGTSVAVPLNGPATRFVVLSAGWQPSGGTASETVTLQITATASDGTTTSSISAAAAGNAAAQSIGGNAISNLDLNGKWIQSLTVAVKSSAASSAATASLTIKVLPVG